MTTEQLKLEIEIAIMARSIACDRTCEIGLLDHEITIMPLRYKAENWKPACEISQSMMDNGMTAQQWNKISAKLSQIL